MWGLLPKIIKVKCDKLFKTDENGDKYIFLMVRDFRRCFMYKVDRENCTPYVY